ncbi:MAG: hypothetical protein H7A40_05695 [Chlamydiales bacterium]|nr:hypothetical protein [Chlamydiales bacterium]
MMSTQSINTDQTTPVIQPKSDDAKGFNSSTAMLALMTALIAYMGQMKGNLPDLQKNYEAMNMFQMMQGWSGSEFRAQFLSDLANKSGGAIVATYGVGVQGRQPVTPEQAGSNSYRLEPVQTSPKVDTPQVIIFNDSLYGCTRVYVVMPESMQATPAQEWAIGMMKETGSQTDPKQASIYTGEDDAMATRAADGMQQKFDGAKLIASNLEEIFAAVSEILGGEIKQSENS